MYGLTELQLINDGPNRRINLERDARQLPYLLSQPEEFIARFFDERLSKPIKNSAKAKKRNR